MRDWYLWLALNCFITEFNGNCLTCWLAGLTGLLNGAVWILIRVIEIQGASSVSVLIPPPL